MASIGLDRASVGVRTHRLERAGRVLLEAAAVQELAETLPETLKAEILNRAEVSIEAVIRLLSETPPSPYVPRPWPAPSKAALDLATDLTVFSNAYLQPGPMQKAVQKIAARLVLGAYKT
jgi:hypothetical protein